MTITGGLLGITQPAVSRLIRELETKVGFELFQRHGSQIKPAPEALMLHREVDRSMQALSRIESAAQGITQLKTDFLRVAATPRILTVYIREAIAFLEREFPDVSIAVNTRTSSAVVDKSQFQDVDLGIAFLSGEVQGLEIEPLDQVEAV